MDNISLEHIDISTLRFLYSRYKGYIIPFFVIIAAILLFIKITVPSIADLLIGYEEQKQSKLAIEIIRQNLNFVKSIDNSRLESQFRIVTKTLPIDKDFDSILNAISGSSNKSGVVLSGFKFIVGNLLKEEIVNEYPSLNLEVTLDGNVEAVDNFIGSLANTLPLSEITKVSAKLDSSIVTIEFYYKTIAASKNSYNLPIVPISGDGLSLIEEMSAFNIPQAPSFDSSVSTPSANPFF
jgi:Tfp pilus assembly protein PilO